MILNAREVFEIAEQIERNGARFYRRAAEFGPTQESRKLLMCLAEMEDEHEILFQTLKEEFTVEEGAGAIPDIDNHALAYLQSMAGGQVFESHDDPAGRLTGQESLEDIYQMAIAFEKDSVVYFTTVKQMVPNELGASGSQTGQGTGS